MNVVLSDRTRLFLEGLLAERCWDRNGPIELDILDGNSRDGYFTHGGPVVFGNRLVNCTDVEFKGSVIFEFKVDVEKFLKRNHLQDCRNEDDE